MSWEGFLNLKKTILKGLEKKNVLEHVSWHIYAHVCKSCTLGRHHLWLQSRNGCNNDAKDNAASENFSRRQVGTWTVDMLLGNVLSFWMMSNRACGSSHSSIKFLNKDVMATIRIWEDHHFLRDSWITTIAFTTHNTPLLSKCFINQAFQSLRFLGTRSTERISRSSILIDDPAVCQLIQYTSL